MNLSISGHHLAVTESLREYVTTKLERVSHHFDQVLEAKVILSVEKLAQKAEITVHVAGRDLYAECTDADMYAAIDCLVDKLDRQVIKHKEKRFGHGHETLKHQPIES